MAGFQSTLYGRLWVTPEDSMEKHVRMEIGDRGRKGPSATTVKSAPLGSLVCKTRVADYESGRHRT